MTKMLLDFYADCCKRDANIYSTIPLLSKDLVLRSLSGYSFIFLRNDGPPLSFFSNYKGRIVFAELHFQLLITVEMLRSESVDYSLIVYLADLPKLQFQCIGCVGQGFSKKDDIKFDINFNLNILLVMNRNTALISFWKMPIILNGILRRKNMCFLGGHRVGCITLPVLSLSSRGQFIAIQGNTNGYIFSYKTTSSGLNPGTDTSSKLELSSIIDCLPSHQRELGDFEECTLFNHYTHFLPNATIIVEPLSYPAVIVRRKRLLNIDNTSDGTSRHSHNSPIDATNDIQENGTDTLEYVSELSLLLSFSSLASAPYSNSEKQGSHGKNLIALHFLHSSDYSNGNINNSIITADGSEVVPNDEIESQKLVVVERRQVNIFVICKILAPSCSHSSFPLTQSTPAEFAFIRMTKFSLPRPAISATIDILPPYLSEPWISRSNNETRIDNGTIYKSLSRSLGNGATLYVRTTENSIDEWLLPYSESIPCCYFMVSPDTEKDINPSFSDYPCNNNRIFSNSSRSRRKLIMMTYSLMSSTASSLFYNIHSPSDCTSGMPGLHFHTHPSRLYPTLLNTITFPTCKDNDVIMVDDDTTTLNKSDILMMSTAVTVSLGDLRLLIRLGLEDEYKNTSLSKSSKHETDFTHSIMTYDRTDILLVVNRILEEPWEVTYDLLVHNQDPQNPTIVSHLNGIKNNMCMLINIFHRLKDFVNLVLKSFNNKTPTTYVDMSMVGDALQLLPRIASKMCHINEIWVQLEDHHKKSDMMDCMINNRISTFWKVNLNCLSIHEIIQNFGSAMKNLCQSTQVTTITASDTNNRNYEIEKKMKILCHNTNILITYSLQQQHHLPYLLSTTHQLDKKHHTTDIYQHCFDIYHIAYKNDIYLLEIIAFLYLKSTLNFHSNIILDPLPHSRNFSNANATNNISNTFANSLLELGSELRLDWSNCPLSLCFMWSFIEKSEDIDYNLRNTWKWLLSRSAVMAVNNRKLSINMSKEFIDMSSSDEFILLELFFNIDDKENSLGKLLLQQAMFVQSLNLINNYLVSNNEADTMIQHIASTVETSNTVQLAGIHPSKLPSLLRNIFLTCSKLDDDIYLAYFLKDLFLVQGTDGPACLVNLLRRDVFFNLIKEVSTALPDGTPDCTSTPLTSPIVVNDLFWRYVSIFWGMMISMKTVVEYDRWGDILPSIAVATEHLQLLCKAAVHEFEEVRTMLSVVEPSLSTIQFSKCMTFRLEMEKLCVPVTLVDGDGNNSQSAHGTIEVINCKRNIDEGVVATMNSNNDPKLETEAKLFLFPNCTSPLVSWQNISMINSLLSMLDFYGKSLVPSESSDGLINGTESYDINIFEESQKQQHDGTKDEVEIGVVNEKENWRVKNEYVFARDDHICLSFILSVFQIVHPLLTCTYGTSGCTSSHADSSSHHSNPSLIQNTNMNHPQLVLNLNTLFDITVARLFPSPSIPVSIPDTSLRSMLLWRAVRLLRQVYDFNEMASESNGSTTTVGDERQRPLRIHVWNSCYLFIHQILIVGVARHPKINNYVHLISLYAFLSQCGSKRNNNNNDNDNPITDQATHSINSYNTNNSSTQQFPSPSPPSSSPQERIWLLQRFENFLNLLLDLLQHDSCDDIFENVVLLIVSVSLNVATFFCLSNKADECNIDGMDPQPKDNLEFWKNIATIMSSKLNPSSTKYMTGVAVVYKEALRVFILKSKKLKLFEDFTEILDILPDTWDSTFLYSFDNNCEFLNMGKT